MTVLPLFIFWDFRISCTLISGIFLIIQTGQTLPPTGNLGITTDSVGLKQNKNADIEGSRKLSQQYWLIQWD